MKKRNLILWIICLVVLICAGGYFLLIGNEKAEIMINGTTYEMCTVSVREFMGEDYIFAVMSTEGNSVYAYNYTDSELEAKTYYNMAVPFRPKDGYGAPISCWLYNPTSKPVEIREAMISSISCEVPALREYNIPVSVAGLELNTQTKQEIKAYMGDALKGYQYSENEDVNAVSYTKGKVSYADLTAGQQALFDLLYSEVLSEDVAAGEIPTRSFDLPYPLEKEEFNAVLELYEASVASEQRPTHGYRTDDGRIVRQAYCYGITYAD